MTLTTVPERFLRQAHCTPEAIALSESGRELSYAETHRQVNRLAHRLLEAGVVRGDRVGLRLGRSIDCVLSILAVLRVGAAYVPLEADLPPDRLRHIAEECRPRLILTGTGLSLNDTRLPVIDLDRDATDIARQPTDEPPVEVEPDDVMYIPYTSGSTGRPKGSIVPHRSVAGFFEPADYARWGPGSVSLHHSALSWDGHLVDLFPALFTGGKVVIHTGDTADPVLTAETASDVRATVLFLSAQAFNIVADQAPHLFSDLEYLITGGEVASTRHFAKALATPGLRLIHAYGPSECTVFTTTHPVTVADLAAPTIPIGRAIGDRRVYILDPAGRRVPVTGTGELYIGGPAVAHGYLNRPRLTAERFVPDPFGEPGSRLFRSGDTVSYTREHNLVFIGRDDTQVKLRGLRIELPEVERALLDHPAIADAAVAVDRDAPDGGRLVGYLVTDGPQCPSPAELRRSLERLLPSGMIPAHYEWLDRLPVNRTGKLDRSALKPSDQRSSVTATERKLAEIWRELLGATEIGRDDDFLGLGGTSLLMSRLVNRIRDRFGVDLPLPAAYRCTRLTDLAGQVEALRASHTPNLTPPRPRRQAVSPRPGAGAPP